jgi:SAM-dependent methyltransferase
MCKAKKDVPCGMIAGTGRKDYVESEMRIKLPKSEKRTPEQIREHYEIEKELADKLRRAPREERRYLYSSLYDELYRRVPFHPQLTRKLSPAGTKYIVASQMRFLHSFLNKERTFLEVGPGDCALSFEVSKFVKQVYAVDVSDEITKASTAPENFQLFLSDGCSVPVPSNSINLAYSYNLMEHLHPDDAIDQLRHIYKALVPGGAYICVTPNRITGPHDVSRFFDDLATGFHLKEYSTAELSDLFGKIGFSRVTTYIGAKGHYVGFPVFPIALCETLLDKLRVAVRNIFEVILPLPLPDIRMVGVK